MVQPTTFLALLALLLAVTTVSAKDTKIHAGASVAAASHSEIEAELRGDPQLLLLKTELQEEEDVKGYTCTIAGATGQDQCDAANDDDGSGCVWCSLQSFGFCVSERQAAQFKQVTPMIDCDDDDDTDDDKAPGPPGADDDTAPGPLWECLEATDEESCASQCVWCNTKGGFGVCLTQDGAALAKDSYWFDCPAESEWMSLASTDDDDDVSGDDDDVDAVEDDEDDEDDMNEFVVDTSCVMAGVLLDPTNAEATSESACFAARDLAGNACEWCSVAGSPFQLCLSEPQAQVAEYVGAVCTGSDASFEPEDFDDSCIAKHDVSGADTSDNNLSKEGCWHHQDLDGNGCEWCNMMGVEICLGGVQAELVEHWGATCVMDHEEHDMATQAIAQHRAYLQAEKVTRDELKTPTADATDDDEEEIDLSTLWLTSDPSCMVTTLRTTSGDDEELACAQTKDAQGNPCNWCEMGTGFNMCLNEEQAAVGEYMGIACDEINTDTQSVLEAHAARAAAGDEYDDDDDDGSEDEEDLYDFDSSCIVTMQNGPDHGACMAAKDADGNKCEWCSYQSFQVCLAAEQATMVEPFGVTCDQTSDRKALLPVDDSPASEQLTQPDIDTSCLINMDESSCTSSADAIENKSCEWCTLGSLGVSGCMSEQQADMAKPLGVTCDAEDVAALTRHQQSQEDPLFLQNLPADFWSCLSQSNGSVDDCDETCTWCDVKGTKKGAGYCLSDDIADVVTHYSGNQYLDCTEPTETLGGIIVDAMDSIA